MSHVLSRSVAVSFNSKIPHFSASAVSLTTLLSLLMSPAYFLTAWWYSQQMWRLCPPLPSPPGNALDTMPHTAPRPAPTPKARWINESPKTRLLLMVPDRWHWCDKSPLGGDHVTLAANVRWPRRGKVTWVARDIDYALPNGGGIEIVVVGCAPPFSTPLPPFLLHPSPISNSFYKWTPLAFSDSIQNILKLIFTTCPIYFCEIRVYIRARCMSAKGRISK